MSALLGISKTLTRELSPALDATFRGHELTGEHWEGLRESGQRARKYSS